MTPDAPLSCSRDFRPLPSNTAPTFTCEASAFARAIEIQGSWSIPPCSALCRLVSTARMASADFCRTSGQSVSRLPCPGFCPVQDGRSPRVMHVTFTPYTRRIYRHILPDGYGALKNMASSPGYVCLICDFCTSGQSFACGFLQIPGRPGHPCRSANGSHHQGP